ncbi:g10677 [Coccomyxa elongata]
MVTDVQVPGPGGNIPVQLYQPSEGATEHFLFYFHGGGFCWGGITSHDAVCRRLAKATQAVIVAVDYRLAPEHPYPAGLDDCCAATQWVYDNAAELKLPRGRFTVGVSGDSAGANLAACLTLRARSDAAFPRLQYQILICPVVRHLRSVPMDGSRQEFKDDPELSFQGGLTAFTAYFGNLDSHIKDPQAFPLEAEDLAGLPPTLILTAERDILRDDGVRYAERLKAAG